MQPLRRQDRKFTFAGKHVIVEENWRKEVKAMREIRAGQFYRHFKGGLYQIVTVATHTETGEKLVVYQALYGDYGVYARPYEMFCSEVDRDKYPEAGQTYRFELVEPGAAKEPERTTGPAPVKAEPEQPVPEPVKAEPESDGVNPILLEFLDADTLEQKLHILTVYRNKMDESLLNSIAISLDLVVEKKGLQEMYDEIINCLSMMKHFECNRLR